MPRVPGSNSGPRAVLWPTKPFILHGSTRQKKCRQAILLQNSLYVNADGRSAAGMWHTLHGWDGTNIPSSVANVLMGGYRLDDNNNNNTTTTDLAR